MSETIRKLDDVFGVSRGLPLNYVERENVDQKLKQELTAGKHIVIYGSSKQGKTCLRKHCLEDSEYILVQCSNRSELYDLHASILKRAGFEVTQSSKKSSSGKNKVVVTFKAQLFGIGTTAQADDEKSVAEEITKAPLEVDVEDVNDVIAALNAIKFTKYIVLEDFHYLPYQTQKDFAVALKAFHETSKFIFVIVGVWLEDNRLIVYNGDLTGRIISVNADRWEEAELSQVMTDGGALMGISFTETFKSEVVTGCLDSVYIVQEACRLICLQSGILETSSKNIELGEGVATEELIKEIVNQQTARYDAFLTNFADGFQDTDLEMHKWILYPLLKTDPTSLEQGLRYRDIRSSLKDVHPRRASLNSGNLVQSLQSVASLQSRKEIMPIVIDYDQTNKKLNVVDKGFIIWLQHQNVDELLEQIGMDVPDKS